MVKEPIISYSGREWSIPVVASFILASVIVASLIFPKLVFASQSADSLGAASPISLSEDFIAPAQQAQQDTVQEEQLIASLMQDVVVSAKPEPKSGWKYVKMRVTGYCPCSQCCGVFSDGITANNHQIQPGDTFVAADKSYRFGMEMVVPGYNADQPVQVMDRGGAIKGNRLDLFFHTHQQALQWGVQYLDVLIKTS